MHTGNYTLFQKYIHLKHGEYRVHEGVLKNILNLNFSLLFFVPFVFFVV